MSLNISTSDFLDEHLIRDRIFRQLFDLTPPRSISAPLKRDDPKTLMC